MNKIEYVIEDVNDFPAVLAEIYFNDELQAKYQIKFPEEMQQVGVEVLREYSAELEKRFNEIIDYIKSEKINYDSVSENYNIIFKIAEIKTSCDQYIERMDIVE